MFTLSLKRLYYLTDKVLVRNLRGKRFVPEANPGLQRRIEAFQNERLKVEDEDAEEFVEQSESDFYNVGEAYHAHLNETIAGKLDLQHHIIKEKYFKENMPNLLTWSEKEQIRYLATTEPDEWTPEKLAESFPVTLPVVKKLLKYAWKPATKERIERHDASAMRNWKELKEGSLDLPEDIRQHYLKFSERTVPPLNQTSLKIDLTQQKMGEFEKIINRCAENNSHNTEPKSTNESNSEGASKSVKRDIKRVTLQELTDKIKKRIDKGTNVDMNDTIIMQTVTSTDITPDTSKQLSNEIHLANENEPSELTHFKESDTDVQTTDYMQRIRIPKKAYKKGATYKVNDCYYDDDGRFLYRVLGMKN